jgi:hypothetical protein
MPAPTSVQTTNNTDTAYVNTLEYKLKADKLQNLISVMDELQGQNAISRRLRYTEIDIEREKTDGKLSPDEVYVPQHIIDSNIRREQSSYVQFVTQSNRAIVMLDMDEPYLDCAIIERDASNRLRFEGWQTSMFANIDGFQQNGYGVMEVVLDETKDGSVAHEFVQLGDLGFVGDTRDVQQCEMVARNYYFSKTRLMSMAGDESWGFDEAQIKLVMDQAPNGDSSTIGSSINSKDKSLYRIHKVMFRYQGTVHVAWACYNICNDWLRAPRPLYIGRRELVKFGNQVQMMPDMVTPQSKEVYETEYPYYIFPYLITENDTISQLKGRAYLDQDTQIAVTSLISSACTAYRRASGLYFAKDSDDPNADVLQQKNMFFKTGCLINQKVKQFQLTPPSADIFAAVQALVTANQSETSKVNFAAQNRKDSRKTATEIDAAQQEASVLSTVQVVLFSNALRSMYSKMFDVVASRVLAKLIAVNELLYKLYQRNYMIKPSGDTDVIERQRRLKLMMDAWPVMQQTPAASIFLSDLLTLSLPDYAPKYIQIFMKASQQPPQPSPEEKQAQMEAQMEQMRLQMEQEKHKADMMRMVAEGQIDMKKAEQELQMKQIEFQQKLAQRAAEADQTLTLKEVLGRQEIQQNAALLEQKLYESQQLTAAKVTATRKLAAARPNSSD